MIKSSKKCVLPPVPDQPQDNRLSDFSKMLCSAWLSANISFKKLENKELRDFLETYMQKKIPDESTLRKTYVEQCYIETMDMIRNEVGENAIWVSADETTDVEGRAVCNFIVGILKSDQAGKKFLLNCDVLEKANHATISTFFEESLKLLWTEGIKYDKVLLFLSDAAPYMVQAAKELSKTYQKMVHVTCLAHGLHRIAEKVRDCFEEVDKMIADTKKVFLKAPARIRLFKEIAPNIPLPPEPVLTRWGTWLIAAKYYAVHFCSLQSVIRRIPPDAASVKSAKKLFESQKLQSDLQLIYENFYCIATAITELETSGQLLQESLKIVEELKEKIQKSESVPEEIIQKTHDVFKKNEGYRVLASISKDNGNEASLQRYNWTPEDLEVLSYAPITSCDVERSFSQYKCVLADNRRSFKFENLRKIMVVHCCKKTEH